MREYLAIAVVPLLLSCGGDGKELSDKVSELELPVAVVSTEVTTTNPRAYCNGPPSISHLFNVYTSMKEMLKSESLDHPSIRRMYDSGEREYQRARDLHNTCKNGVDDLIANQLAINSIYFMTEALTRQQELRKGAGE